LEKRFKINMLARSLGMASIIYIFELGGTLAIPATAQTVTVDMSGNLGAPTYRASGFLYGLSFDGTFPAAGLLNPLKPRIERGGGTGLAGGGWSIGGLSAYRTRFTSVLAQYKRVHPFGTTYEILVSDLWGAYGTQTSSGLWPGDNGDWTSFNNFLSQLASDVAANHMTNVHYDIWNEPNEPGTGSQFWVRSQTQYFTMWNDAVTILRKLSPDVPIVGPSNPGYVSSQMGSWLSNVNAAGTLPDYINWHFSNTPVTDVANARALLAAQNITVRGEEMNEYLVPNQQIVGYQTFYIDQLERSGIELAEHAIWAPSGFGTLDNILTSDLTPQRTGLWWGYERYASMTGTIVSTTPIADVDDLASQDPSTKTASILLGNDLHFTGNLTVDVTNLSSAPYLSINGTVHVIVEKIANQSPLLVPIQIINANYPVSNGQIDIIIPWTNPVDAYFISLTPGGSFVNDKVYSLKRSSWVPVVDDANGASIAVDSNGYIWHTDTFGHVWEDTGSQPETQKIGISNAVDIAGGGKSKVAVLKNDQSIQMWNGSIWTQMVAPDGATGVALDSDGNLWYLDPLGNVYYLNGSTSIQVPGVTGAVDIGAGGRGIVAVVLPNRTIERWDGTRWTAITDKGNAGAVKVAVDSEGNVWDTNTAGEVWEYTSTGQGASSWARRMMTGCATDIGAMNGIAVLAQPPRSQWPIRFPRNGFCGIGALP
jgi:hypothetical protein